jgi:fatty acid desaturase
MPFRPFVYAFRTAVRFKREGKEVFSRMKKRLGRIQNAERVCLLLFFVLILWLDWRKIPHFVILPWVFGNYFIVYTNLLFHKGTDPDAKLTCSLNYLNRIEGWIFLNGGYHTMHHINPNVHWSQLPGQHRIHVEPFIDRKCIRGSMVIDTLRQYFNPFRLREGMRVSPEA